jgi:N-acetylmuramoyl-L-alanine amidase
VPVDLESKPWGIRIPLFKYAAVFFLCPATVIALGQSTIDRKPAALLNDTARLLTELSHPPQTTVPDAVLNRTQCMVVIPPGANRLRLGTAACRETADQWNAPTLVTFEGRTGRRRVADLLVFVLGDKAVQALRSGSLRIQTDGSPVPPLAPQKAIPSEEALSAEVFTYEYAGHRLYGGRVRGLVRQEQSDAGHRPNGALDASEKTTKQYLSSLTSFFNTIVPSGIVIHHTAVLPDEDAPPKNKHQVDKYHATRGFEITCSGHHYHVAYHYIILPNGRVQSGRPDLCEGAHAKGYNSYLGIAMVGDFDSRDNPNGEKGPTKPSSKQIAALVRLCQRLMLQYKIPVTRIVRHSDVAATRCPGDRFPFQAFLRDLKAIGPGLASSSASN